MSAMESSGGESVDEAKDPNHVDWRHMENIRVICRFRPINSREIREEKSAHLIDSPPEICNSGTCVKVRRAASSRAQGAPMQFYLDKILGSNTTQQNMYINVGKPMVEACLEGYNSTIFAYGQTGSGKTYTMFGPEKQQLKSNHELGCVQRCISFLFAELQQRVQLESVTEFKVLLHFVQMYREKLLDLLEPNKGIPLKIRYDPQTDSPYVANLKSVDVTEMMEVMKLLSLANKNRITDKTNMNAVSSRSHMIMTLSIEQTLKDGTVKKSKLNFADLAGSETFQKALGGHKGGVDKKKMEELKTINLSLTNLTTCINYLSKGRKPSYRSSQLTFYLMDSLGGNSKTTLIVAASPHIFNRTETISTLRFAKTAKSVKNKAHVNKELSKAQLMKLVKKLRRENKKLKAQLALTEAELSKNGIEFPAETEKKRKGRKRSKSMAPSMAVPSTNTNLLFLASASSGDLKSLTQLQEAMTTSITITDKKLKFGKMNNSAYYKLKSELKSLQNEFNQQEIEASILYDQMQKKNLMLKDTGSQMNALEEDKEQLRWQLEHMEERFKTEMDGMKLSNEELMAEVNALEQSIAMDQKKENKIESLSQNIMSITTAYEGKKDSTISNLRRENKQLKQEIVELQRTKEENKMDSGEDADELFDLNDQLEYLENIGKGIDMNDMDVERAATHKPAQIAQWRQELAVGSKMDCLDEARLWWTSIVTDCDRYRIKVRYNGFDAHWDEWVDRGSTRIAPHLSKAKGNQDRFFEVVWHRLF
eukprot:170299_1